VTSSGMAFLPDAMKICRMFISLKGGTHNSQHDDLINLLSLLRERR
jgi:hypothetical protein